MYERVIIDDDKEELGLDKSDFRVIQNRAEVRAELDALEIPTLSFLVFKKNPYEIGLLIRCKKRWREEMKAAVPNWTRKSDHYTKKAKIW